MSKRAATEWTAGTVQQRLRLCRGQMPDPRRVADARESRTRRLGRSAEDELTPQCAAARRWLFLTSEPLALSTFMAAAGGAVSPADFALDEVTLVN